MQGSLTQRDIQGKRVSEITDLNNLIESSANYRNKPIKSSRIQIKSNIRKPIEAGSALD